VKAPDFTVAERWAQVRCAKAQEPADLIVRSCQIVNVYSREVHPGDIAIKDGIIVAIREGFSGEAVRILDGAGRFAVPGIVISHGLPESRAAPSSGEGRVGLASGATSVVRDVTAGEGDPPRELPQRQWTATRLGLSITSQAPACARSADEVLTSLRSGYPTFLGPGPAQGSASLILRQLWDKGVDIRRICLGRWDPGDGGMEAAVRLARAVIADCGGIGLAPAEACAMATLNPAIVFGLDHRVGSIAPGRFADFWLTEDLGSHAEVEVILGGRPADSQAPR
jgi:adenine deaminase